MFASTELVPYSKATEIATRYAKATAEIERLIGELGERVNELRDAFKSETESSYDFDLELELSRKTYRMNQDGTKQILREFKRNAWRILIEKLGIRKLMSQKQADELDAQLYESHRQRWNDRSPLPELPEIDSETITGVMCGMIQSAPDFLTEKIRETYNWLVPHRWEGGHKTNKRDRIGRKVIKGYSVDPGWHENRFRVHHTRQKDLMALDSIFHALDGAGVPPGHNGPLVEAINTAPGGIGETEYFRFKCYKNGNLHLEFKKLDLLDRFNRVAVDGHHIGAEAAR